MDINFGASISPYAGISYPAPSTVNKGSDVTLGNPGGGGGPQVLQTNAGVTLETNAGVALTTNS